jgi:hypothetical protein
LVFRGWGSKVCEESICKGRHQFVKMGIEELGIFLEGFELAKPLAAV